MPGSHLLSGTAWRKILFLYEGKGSQNSPVMRNLNLLAQPSAPYQNRSVQPIIVNMEYVAKSAEVGLCNCLIEPRSWAPQAFTLWRSGEGGCISLLPVQQNVTGDQN